MSPVEDKTSVPFFHYYVRYQDLIWRDDDDSSNRVRMELISNYEDAVTHMDDGYSTSAHFWDHEDTVMKLPWIITDDLRLTLRYRNAFTEEEFRLWCVGDHIDVEAAQKGYKWNELEMARKCNLGYGGPKVMEHFNRIRNGEITSAWMAYRTEYDQDPYDGRKYSSEYFKGWETSNRPREIRFEVLEVERDPIVVYASTKTKPDTVFKTGFELADTPLEKGGFTNIKVSDYYFAKAEEDGEWMNLHLVTMQFT